MKTDQAPAKRHNPLTDPAYIARAKSVLNTLDITQDGKAVTGEPTAGEYAIKRKLKRTTDVRTPDEITGLLARLFPAASFKWITVLVALFMVAACAMADDTVAPASCTWTNTRGEATAGISGTFFKGTTLRGTNCATRIDATTTQGLAGVTVTVTISDETTSTNFNATVQDAANGKFFFNCTLSTNFLDQARVQIKLTDGAGSSYIYPWKVLNMKDPED
jgi:hypothetical protein